MVGWIHVLKSTTVDSKKEPSPSNTMKIARYVCDGHRHLLSCSCGAHLCNFQIPCSCAWRLHGCTSLWGGTAASGAACSKHSDGKTVCGKPQRCILVCCKRPLKWIEINWNQLKSIEINRNQLKSIEINRNQIKSTEILNSNKTLTESHWSCDVCDTCWTQ